MCLLKSNHCSHPQIKELKEQLAEAHKAAVQGIDGPGLDIAGGGADNSSPNRPESEIGHHGGAEGTLAFRLLSDGPWQKGFFKHDKAQGALLLFSGALQACTFVPFAVYIY